MEQQLKYTLGKNERLKSRKAIDLLFAEGKSFSVFPLKVIYSFKKNNPGLKTLNFKPETLNLSAAFSVSKRNFKKAVDRNRIKRLMRESYRLQKNELLSHLITNKESIAVFILYTGNELPEYDLVFSKMTSIIKRLQKIVNEKSAGDT